MSKQPNFSKIFFAYFLNLILPTISAYIGRLHLIDFYDLLQGWTKALVLWPKAEAFKQNLRPKLLLQSVASSRQESWFMKKFFELF